MLHCTGPRHDSQAHVNMALPEENAPSAERQHARMARALTIKILCKLRGRTSVLVASSTLIRRGFFSRGLLQ